MNEVDIIEEEIEESKAIATIESSETTMLSIIAQAAQNPNVDPDKMNKLLDVQMKMMDRQAEINFNKAMSALRKELTPVIKNKKNNQTNSKYADLEIIKKAIDPLLTAHGFYDRYDDEFTENGIRTTCEIVHEDGHSKKNTVTIALDESGIKGTVNKTKPHATASSMTYSQRLSLCRALGITIAEDDDGNAAGAQPITEEQVTYLQTMLDATDTDTQKFCEWAGYDALAHIPQSQYNRLKNALIARQKKAKEGEKNDSADNS